MTKNPKILKHEKIVAEMKNFDQRVFQFKAKHDEVVEFEFNYDGNEILQSVKPGCGCTNVTLAENKIWGEIHVGVNEPQQFSKYLTVYFKDGYGYYTENEKGNMVPEPRKLSVSLTLKGTIK